MEEYYKKELGLEGSKFTLINSEEAMVSIAYKIESGRDPNLILKICTREQDYKRELKFLEYFKNKIPLPKVIRFLESKEDQLPGILMEELPGASLQKSNITESLAFDAGALLAKIHQNEQSSYGDITNLKTLCKDPKAPFILKFKEGLEECKGHLPKILLGFCKKILEENINKLDSSDGPRLIHRDYRPANIITNNGKVQGIIDWSSARSSFAEEDFCPLEHGEWELKETYKKKFFDGYSSIRKVPNYKKVMPLLRLHRALAVVGFTVKRGTWRTIHSKPYRRNRTYIEESYSNSESKE